MMVYPETKHSKIIVLFTSNFIGGILQFTMQLGSTLCSLGYKIILYVPDNSTIDNIANEKMTIIKFSKQKNLGFKSKSSRKISREICEFNPALVLFCDETIISTQVILSLPKNIFTALIIHDVIAHIGNYNLYENIKTIINRSTLYRAVQITNKVILLSQNSYNQFCKLYPIYSNKALIIPLGAHLPQAEQVKPPEIVHLDGERYYLFFGRIEKYKGIFKLLQAYQNVKTNKPALVIAGQGKLQSDENDLIDKNENILLINRYIEDGEMLYLINNSLTVVLPYIEATQSGVLPIAYHFKVPVITSNVAGLIEFVINGQTGIICNSIEEMTDALTKICNQDYRDRLGIGAFRFYSENLSWESNFSSCIDSIMG